MKPITPTDLTIRLASQHRNLLFVAAWLKFEAEHTVDQTKTQLRGAGISGMSTIENRFTDVALLLSMRIKQLLKG